MRTKEIEKIAADAAAHFDGKTGFANAGKLNAYSCRGKRGVAPGGGFQLVQTAPPCGRTMVTIDREPGVTPFIVQCPDCGGEAQSSGYRGINPAMVATHEWYRPDSLEGLEGWALDHVGKGGLLLRPIEGAEADALRAKREAADRADDEAKREAANDDGHRRPEWVRFTGDLAVVAMVDGNTPTVGIASDVCDECDTRRVLIACISDAGHECNIGVSPETGLQIADAIRAAALKVIELAGKS